jgi:hypothetical protein
MHIMRTDERKEGESEQEEELPNNHNHNHNNNNSNNNNNKSMRVRRAPAPLLPFINVLKTYKLNLNSDSSSSSVLPLEIQHLNIGGDEWKTMVEDSVRDYTKLMKELREQMTISCQDWLLCFIFPCLFPCWLMYVTTDREQDEMKVCAEFEEIMRHRMVIYNYAANLNPELKKDNVQFRMVEYKSRHYTIEVGWSVREISTANYRQWTVSEIVQWILSLAHGRLHAYEQTLQSHFEEENIDVECLKALEKDDFRRYGIKDFRDRQFLLSEITKLGGEQMAIYI